MFDSFSRQRSQRPRQQTCLHVVTVASNQPTLSNCRPITGVFAHTALCRSSQLELQIFRTCDESCVTPTCLLEAPQLNMTPPPPPRENSCIISSLFVCSCWFLRARRLTSDLWPLSSELWPLTSEPLTRPETVTASTHPSCLCNTDLMVALQRVSRYLHF